MGVWGWGCNVTDMIWGEVVMLVVVVILSSFLQSLFGGAKTACTGKQATTILYLTRVTAPWRASAFGPLTPVFSFFLDSCVPFRSVFFPSLFAVSNLISSSVVAGWETSSGNLPTSATSESSRFSPCTRECPRRRRDKSSRDPPLAAARFVVCCLLYRGMLGLAHLGARS